MRKWWMVALVAVLAGGCGGSSTADETEPRLPPTTITAAPTTTTESVGTATTQATGEPSTTTTSPPTTVTPTTPSPTTTTAVTLPPQPFCRDLAAAGYTYREALDYWLDHGTPTRMDADRNGIPCETVYDRAATAAVLSELTPVTRGDVFPAALSRDLVPWSRIGPGWYLTSFIGGDVWGETAESMTTRPTVLYLAHQSGLVYELDSWPGLAMTKWIHDWSPDGRYAIVTTRVGFEGPGEVSTHLIDLVTLDTVARLAEESGPVDHRYSFTRPTGRNIVHLEHNWDSGVQRLRRLRRDGSVITTIASQTSGEWQRSLDYLYLHDGTGLVLSGLGGMSIVRNDGTWVRDLWAPDEMWCQPNHWYDAGTFAASCFSDDPEVLPFPFFSETWLIPVDGSSGTPVSDELTAQLVAEGIHVGFEGFHGAWPTPDGTLVQGVGDCGAAWIEVLDDQGHPVGGLPGKLLLGVHDGVAVIQTWKACDGTPGSLIAVTTSGRQLRDLVRAEDPIGGVFNVHGLAEVFP